MVDALKKNEQELKEQTYEAHKALQELDEQKFALDSHSIVSVTNMEGELIYVMISLWKLPDIQKRNF